MIKRFSLILIGLLFVVGILFSRRRLKTRLFLNQNYNGYQNSSSLRDSFVNPEHKLITILSNISSGSKLSLQGSCKSLLFTKNTIDKNISDDLLKLLKYVINSINILSSNEYYIKEVENAYIQNDRNNNSRYILDFFMYDVKNYYTVRVITDIIVIDSIVYMNYINVLPNSTTNMIDRYNYKFNNQGILIDSDMFQEGMDKLLDASYKKHYKIIGVKDTTSDYSNLDLSSVLTVHSLANMYLPNYMTTTSYDYFKSKEISGHLEKYYPSDQTTIASPQFCQKYSNQNWDNMGIPTTQTTNSNCIVDHNQYSTEYNQPWSGPGIMYDRSSNDRYKWLKDPARGNIIRSHGY